MTDFLPKSVQDELAAARTAAGRTRGRMKVRAGGREFVILRYWETGFALPAGSGPGPRGLVELYDGERLVAEALIVTSTEEDGERAFEFKRSTAAADTAPAADFVPSRPSPSGFLPRP